MADRDILEILRSFRKSMPAAWHGNAMIDAAIAEIKRLRATPPAAPAQSNGYAGWHGGDTQQERCGRAGGNCQCTSIEECPRAFAQQNQE